MSEVKALTAREEIQLANMMFALNAPVAFSCEYKNWRGEVSRRHLVAVELWHGSTDWHPEPGLLLKAIDQSKDAIRDFRVADFDLSTLRVAQSK
ncbi:hypothetical protein ACGYKD_11650 [Sulfitobacter sp. TB366]|uniref:hypothetical protein n=1 Tax=Sulfitobacter sp. TB366 TaxID=3368580 RepID=UPI0037463779